MRREDMKHPLPTRSISKVILGLSINRLGPSEYRRNNSQNHFVHETWNTMFMYDIKMQSREGGSEFLYLDSSYRNRICY